MKGNNLSFLNKATNMEQPKSLSALKRALKEQDEKLKQDKINKGNETAGRPSLIKVKISPKHMKSLNFPELAANQHGSFTKIGGSPNPPILRTSDITMAAKPAA